MSDNEHFPDYEISEARINGLAAELQRKLKGRKTYAGSPPVNERTRIGDGVSLETVLSVRESKASLEKAKADLQISERDGAKVLARLWHDATPADFGTVPAR